MTNYQVFVTPLISTGHYGSEVEISDWVLSDNIGEITRAIDSTNFDVGVYAYNDVTLICDASDGYLLDQTDSRSIFKFARDKAKVRIVFLKDGVALTTFRGIIVEAGVSIDAQNETVSLTVMTNDSVFLNTLIGAGVVPDGCTFKQAFVAILNAVSSGLLNIDTVNINPVYNGTVDAGKAFDNKTAKDALDALLLPANSVLRIDSSQNVTVGSRISSNNPTLFLYGKGDLEGRENVVLLSSHNNGFQRTFNAIRVTGAQATVTVSGSDVSQPAKVGVAQDATSIEFYGYRLKKFTIDFVTQQATLDAIAAALLLEFRYPKPELEATVLTELLQSQSPATDLLDLVSINNPLSVRPLPGCRLPFIGITSIGDATAPLPFTEGALVIDPSVAWKVIEIRENPQDFTSVLKLRVNGSGLNDGNFVYLLTEAGDKILTEHGENLSL